MRTIRTTLLLLALAAPAVSAAPQEGVTREQQALSDEQALIVRKLARLRASMLRLAERYETEGRAHAARLLRDALVHLDERNSARASKTLDELMSEAESGLGSGQVVQAIEDQKAVVAELERLLSILMDRPDLDRLQSELETLQRLRADLGGLANEEREISRAIEALREAAKNDAQRALEAGLDELAQEQAQLLAENERGARESGAMQREALEARLRELLADQETDVTVAESWRPEAREALEEWLAPLEAARAESSREERLAAAAARLRALEDASREDAEEGALDAALQAAEAAAQREERHARAGADPAARQAAEALREAVEAAKSGDASAASEQAEALERAARNHRERADDAREGLAAAAAESEHASEDLREALARAAESGDAEATAEALAALRRALDEQRFLGQALAGSQDQNAERAERIAEGLERAEGSEESSQALQQAAEAMREAARAAAERDAESTSNAAERAREALERAAAAMESSRRESAQGSEGSEALAEAQRRLGERAAGLEQQSSQASLSQEARRDVEEQLDAAREAMERAAEALEEGRRGDAAAEQREAMSALQEAARESRAGTQPDSEEMRREAAELAERQREVEQRLYEFRKAYEESQRETPLPSLERAEQNARQSGQELDQGDLDQAEREAERAEREIEEALDQLAEEERQYQRLRDEELLFQIAEEVALMIETHEALTTEITELDAERTPGDRASRAQKLRLRKASREVQALADRAGELRQAISSEGSTVFAELFQRIEDDLVRISTATGEVGGYQSGPRVQALLDDVGRDLVWLLESLEEEKDRRQQEEAQQQGGQQGPQQPSENRLVPDAAELKLLTRMEGEVLDSLDELLVLYPELAEGGEIDPLLLEEISRLAQRHRRTTELFGSFRERLGLPDPDAVRDSQ